jgi:hypothetical protein
MAGVQYEGEKPPERSEEEDQAIRAWNLMANGSGGIDWSALPIAVAMFGIEDQAALVQRLLVIKTHSPPKDK